MIVYLQREHGYTHLNTNDSQISCSLLSKVSHEEHIEGGDSVLFITLVPKVL